MTDSVIDRIKAEGRGAEVLSSILGTKIAKDKTTAIRCLTPANHKNGDKHPSCVCKPDAVRLDCICGLSLGLFDLVVEKGLASDAPSAAKWLESTFYGTNGHSNGTKTDDGWPYFPNTAKKLGWTLVDDDGVPCLRCPTFTPEGEGKIKLRFKKGMGRETGAFCGDGEVGLLGLDKALEATESKEDPTVALVCGETDLLAWTWHAQDEGIDIPAVSHSAGEASSLTKHLPFFKGMNVLFFPDNDKPGKEAADKRVTELKTVAKSVKVAYVPTGKDVCDYLRGGGKVRELLRIEEKQAPQAIEPADDMAIVLETDPPPPPEELVERLITRPGVVIVYGASGSGKSYALMAAAVDIAMGGGCFCGVESLQLRPRATKYGGEPDRVLWVYGSEDTKRRIHRRLIDVIAGGPHAGKKLEPGRFFAITPGAICLGSPEGIAWLDQQIAASKATWVILDTIQSLVRFNLRDETPVGAWMIALHHLRDNHQTNITPVAHTAKAATDAKSPRGKADSLLGSQAWRALADGMVMIDAQDGDASEAHIRLIKGKDVDDPIPPIRLTFDGPRKRFREMDESEEKPQRAKMGRPSKTSVENVIAAISPLPADPTWDDLPTILGCEPNTLRNAKPKLQSALLAHGYVIVGGTIRRPKPA